MAKISVSATFIVLGLTVGLVTSVPAKAMTYEECVRKVNVSGVVAPRSINSFCMARSLEHSKGTVFGIKQRTQDTTEAIKKSDFSTSKSVKKVKTSSKKTNRTSGKTTRVTNTVTSTPTNNNVAIKPSTSFSEWWGHGNVRPR